MRIGLLAALLLLVGAIVALVLALVVSRQRQRLARRIEEAVPAAMAVAAPEEESNLRLRRTASERLIILGKLVQFPMDLPRAHVIPAGWVIALAVVVAILTAWFGQLLTGWYVGIAEGLFSGFVIMRMIFGWELSRYRGRLVRQLPDAVQLVVSATRAGLPVTEAFQAIATEMASPTRDEFTRVWHELTMGVSPDQALLGMHRRTGVTEYAIFAVTIGVQMRSGGRLAETIQSLADTVRERLQIAARARALAGEAKVSAIIMAILPVIAGLLLSIARPGHLDPLFNDPRGVRMFLFGVTTLILGALTMRQLIRGATKD